MSRALQIGDFGTVRTSGLVGALIRIGTRSVVNHAFVYIGNGQIVEAQPSGAIISDASNYPSAFWVNLPGVSLNQRLAIGYAARKLVGTPYGFVDIAVLAAACAGLHSHAIDARIETMHALICSQLVDRACELAGVHLFDDGRLSGQVTPGDLYTLGLKLNAADTARSSAGLWVAK